MENLSKQQRLLNRCSNLGALIGGMAFGWESKDILQSFEFLQSAPTYVYYSAFAFGAVISGFTARAVAESATKEYIDSVSRRILRDSQYFR